MCVYVYKWLCMYKYVQCMHVCMYVCMYVCIHGCIYVFWFGFFFMALQHILDHFRRGQLI